jgi:hypothetical protein
MLGTEVQTLRRLEGLLDIVDTDIRLAQTCTANRYYAVDYYLLYQWSRGFMGGEPTFPLWPLINPVLKALQGRLLFLPPSVEEMRHSLTEELRRWYRAPTVEDLTKLRQDPAAAEFRSRYRAYKEGEKDRNDLLQCLSSFLSLNQTYGGLIATVGRFSQRERLFVDPCGALGKILSDPAWFAPWEEVSHVWGIESFGLSTVYSNVLDDLDMLRPTRKATNPTDASVYAMCAWLNEQAGEAPEALVFNLTDGYVKEILARHPVEVAGRRTPIVRDLNATLLLLALSEKGLGNAKAFIGAAKSAVRTLYRDVRRGVQLDSSRPPIENALQVEAARELLEAGLREKVFDAAMREVGLGWNWLSLGGDHLSEPDDLLLGYAKIWADMQAAFQVVEYVLRDNPRDVSQDLQTKNKDLLEVVDSVYKVLTQNGLYSGSWEQLTKTLDETQKKLVAATRSTAGPLGRGDEFATEALSGLKSPITAAKEQRELLGRWGKLLEKERATALSIIRSHMREAAQNEDFKTALACQQLLTALQWGADD